MASDMRFAAPGARTAFLFVRVGLAGCDMGACAICRASSATAGGGTSVHRPLNERGGGVGVGIFHAPRTQSPVLEEAVELRELWRAGRLSRTR